MCKAEIIVKSVLIVCKRKREKKNQVKNKGRNLKRIIPRSKISYNVKFGQMLHFSENA